MRPAKRKRPSSSQPVTATESMRVVAGQVIDLPMQWPLCHSGRRSGPAPHFREFVPKKLPCVALNMGAERCLPVWVRSVAYQSREEAVMSVQNERPASVVAFAPNPKKGRPDTTVLADDTGDGIIALLHKAADMAKEDCARAMDLAHKLSFQLRDAEERARELEAQATHFRERAARAEDWLVRIHNEVEQTFFAEKERQNGRREK